MRTKVYGLCQAVCSQSFRIGFLVSQVKSTQPRASSAFWSAPASNVRGVSSDIVTVWWLGRFQHKRTEIFEQLLWVVFGDPMGAVE